MSIVTDITVHQEARKNHVTVAIFTFHLDFGRSHSIVAEVPIHHEISEVMRDIAKIAETAIAFNEHKDG